VDRIDTLIAKINAVDRFNSGEVKLLNEEEALTGLFNGLLRYMLDEWVAGPPIPPDRATAMATRMITYLSFGLREPSRSRMEMFITEGDEQIVPLLVVRWLARNASIRIAIPRLGEEWREFVIHYQHVIAALDPHLFSFSGDR
jgi:hypothetical protein